MNVWDKSQKVGKTFTNKGKSITIPNNFETKMPDGTIEVYDKISIPPIKVSTASGKKYLYTPITYQSRTTQSIITYDEKNGWGGFFKSNSGKNYTMSSKSIVIDDFRKDTSIKEENVCQTVSLKTNEKGKQFSPPIGRTPWTNTEFYNPLIPINKICTFYIEVSYGVFFKLGLDETTTLSYVNNYFLGIKNLFAREGIVLKLNKIYINTSPVPGASTADIYTSPVPEALVYFKDRTNSNIPEDPEAHFKQLLYFISGGIGGIAHFPSSLPLGNGYETPNPGLPYTLMSSVTNLYGAEVQPLPQDPTQVLTYNKPIVTGTHEIGHSLGSRHSHACLWKNDEGGLIGKLDSCYQSEGSCSPNTQYISSWSPSIMSYCHLVRTSLNSPPTNPTKWEQLSGTTYQNTKNLMSNGFTKYPRHAIRSNLYLSNDIPFETSQVLPTVSTFGTVTNVTTTSASCGGVVSNIGDSEIIQRGLIWSTESEPNMVNSTGVVLAQYGSLGSFTLTAGGLFAGTTYYIRAFATNFAGTSYGEVISFVTLPPGIPSLTTKLNGYTNSRIYAGGTNITSLGLVFEKGLIWSTSINLTNYDQGNVVPSNSTGLSDFNLTISNLFGNTTYYIRSYAKNITGIGYGEILTINTYPSTQISLSNVIFDPPINNSGINLPMTGQGSLRCQVKGELTSDGGYEIIQRGFCWSTSPQPTIDDPNDFYNTENFSFPTWTKLINNLSPSTQYYLRAFVTYSGGTVYSEDFTFTTLQTSMNITNISIDVNNQLVCKILYNTNESLREPGFIYSTSNPNPIFGNNAPGGSTVTLVKVTNGITYTLDNILQFGSPGQTIYIRAFVKDQWGGVIYGTTVPYILSTEVPVITSTLADITTWTPNSVRINANVTNDQGSPILDRGVVWGSESFFDPVANGPFNQTKSTTGTLGEFTIDASPLAVNTTYYIRVYAKNQNGTGYGPKYTIETTGIPKLTTTSAVLTDFQSTGKVRVGGEVLTDWGSPITQKGICYSTSSNVNLLNSTVSISQQTTNIFSQDIPDPNNTLLSGTIYYYRSFATNSYGTGYGDEKTFTTPQSQSIPTLTTVSISNLLYNSATSGGVIQSNGNSQISQTGVCWSTSPNPTIELSEKTSDGPNNTSFTSTLINLDPLETYYVRSYATNGIGTGYGNELSFTTPPSPFPVVTTSNSVVINSTSSSSGGNVINQGDGPVTQRGVIWSTLSNNININLPTKTTNGSGSGQFTSNITGLNPNTTYYIKAYAKNNFGVGYGNLVGITTPQSGDKNCMIVGIDVFESSTPQGFRWFCQFNLNPNCPNYKVDVSRYASNPNNNPNLQPTSTYIINNANPLTPNTTDINNGYIKLLMKPQPSSIDPIFGGWFSLNVKCNGLCNTNVVTKYYFFIPPP